MTLYVVVGLIAAVLSVYAVVARADFIHFDDNTHVFANRLVMGGLSWTGIEKAFLPHASLWIPLTTLSFMTDISLFGLNPGAMHIENLLWHTASTVLLFLTLRRITGSLWPSAVVAALFGLHPLNVESVAWITERKNVLCAFFWIASIAAYARYAERPHWRAYSLAFLFAILAVMAKPMAVTLPFTLLLLDYWPLSRLRTTPSRKLIFEKIPFFALTVAASVIALISREESQIITLQTMSIASRLSNALASYMTYLGQMIYPVNLGIFYPHPGASQPALASVAAALFIAISVAAWIYRKRCPYLIFGWFWFLGTLVPSIGLVQAGSQARADRFTYIPQLGFFIAVAWLISNWKFATTRATAIATACVLAVFGVLTARQASLWLDGATIFEHTIAVTENNAIAYANAGIHRSKDGDFDKAVDHFYKSLQISPRHASVWGELGKTFLRMKRPQEAASAFRFALHNDPNDFEMQNQLAIALREGSPANEAVRELQLILGKSPNSPALHYNLGLALDRTGKHDEARQHLLKAESLAPSDPKIKAALRHVNRATQ